jgi:predicted hydrocarbon binding protein
MTEARVGRLLAACLHQAIADELPQRLDFYEEWLTSEGLRDGNIGAGPMTAVLGFLRTEGGAYDAVVAHAGRLAADWTVQSLAPMRRRAIGWLPRPMRTRAAIRVATEIVSSISSASRASARVRRRAAQIDVQASLFCAVRGAAATPLCGFYVAMIVETLRQFGIGAFGRVVHCHAVGGGACVFTLDLAGTASAADPAMAA